MKEKLLKVAFVGFFTVVVIQFVVIFALWSGRVFGFRKAHPKANVECTCDMVPCKMMRGEN